jgi:nicotinate phosphoribosyltransferase
MKYGIPVFGTMAHSFIMLFDKEVEAFRAFSETFPKTSTLLIDTYDDIKGAQNAAIVAKELEKKGFRLSGVRIDSGDLVEVSKTVRKILDEKVLAMSRFLPAATWTNSKYKNCSIMAQKLTRLV